MLLLAHYRLWADMGKLKDFRNTHSDFIFFNSEMEEAQVRIRQWPIQGYPARLAEAQGLEVDQVFSLLPPSNTPLESKSLQ